MEQTRLSKEFKAYLDSLESGFETRTWSFNGKTDDAFGSRGGSWQGKDGYRFKDKISSKEYMLRCITEDGYIVLESYSTRRQIYNMDLSKATIHLNKEGESVLFESFIMTVGKGRAGKQDVREAFKRIGVSSNVVARIDDNKPDWNQFITSLLKWANYREQVKNLIKTTGDSMINTREGSVENTGNSNIQSSMVLNQILFGPPGTGKTHFLLENILPQFKKNQPPKANEIIEAEVVSSLPWWKVIALILMEEEKLSVPEIKEHKYLKYKLETSNTNSLNQTVWGQLSSHTINESKTVEYSLRQGVLLFDKNEDSTWYVAKKDHPVIQELNELKDEIAAYKRQTDRDESNYKFVTFHQSTSYENFVEGITPLFEEESAEKNGEIKYEIKKGSFYHACEEAAKLAGFIGLKDCLEKSKEERIEKFKNAPSYCLLIDEINRGNVSAILGELITLIEEDKRLTNNEIIVELPYSRRKFGVPPNLYIIGTMNTADRSVEALDTALRRRFSFTEMPPKPDLLEPSLMLQRLWIKHADSAWSDPQWTKEEKDFFELFGATISNEEKYKSLELEDDLNILSEIFEDIVEFEGLNLREVLKTMNGRIEKLLDRDHLIGHSYLIQVNSWEDLKESFYRNIIPLLQEYFFGDYAKIGAVLGSGFVYKDTGADQIGFASGFEGEDFAEKDIYQIIDYRENQPGYTYVQPAMTFEKAIRLLMNQALNEEIEG